MYVHLTRVSRNAKTGPIPVSTTSAATCPDSCPFKNNGCYAAYGPIKMHWDKVTSGERSLPWADFLAAIRRLPLGQLWRHNQAGDLPGDGEAIDAVKLLELTKANRGRRGFTYTHKPLTPQNALAIRKAVRTGFTINVSTNSLAEADALLATTRALPVVAVVPENSPDKGLTPNGNKFIVCPAQVRDDVSCATCGLCQNADPKRPIVAFKAHGAGKKRIEATLV